MTTRRRHHLSPSELSVAMIKRRYDNDIYGPEISDTIKFLLSEIERLEG